MWRLIVDGHGDGAWNMAVDRALQIARESDDAPPTLRLYGWSVPTLTLGRFQDVSGIDLEACRRTRVDVVRRATGGRGVIHDDEVTYCVAASADDGVPRGTVASYGHLGAGVVEAYRVLGVDAHVTSRSRGNGGASACYLHTTQADVSSGSSKLSGGAQVWRGGTCMQHGSFTRTRDVERERAVFRLDDTEAATLRAEAATLDDLAGDVPDEPTMFNALIEGFSRALGIRLEPGSLSADERDLVRTLLEEGGVGGA